MEGLEGFGGAGRVWWSSKGSVEPEGFGGARRVWWGPKGLVGPEGFGGVRRVWWGLKGLAGFEGFGGVGFRKAAAETGIYASRAAHTLAPSASARDAASSPARRKRTIRTASRDIPH